MPASSTLRKRCRCSLVTTDDSLNNSADRLYQQESSTTTTRMTLASRLRKRVEEETSRKTEVSVKRLKTEEDDTSIKDVNDCITEETDLCNFQSRRSMPIRFSTQLCRRPLLSHNLAHYLFGASLGTLSSVNKKSVLSPVAREVQDLSLFRTASPFDRRVTALEWHPTIPNMVVAGSKGGDLIFWNSLQQNLNDCFIPGIGAGGSIQAVKFWPWNSEFVLTASIDGRVMVRDFEQRQCHVLSDTFNCIDSWYCCVDVNAAKKVVVTGDNVGNTLLLSDEGKQLWSHRLHKQKVTHAEFSPREDWLLCTASTDSTVKVWDIRNISGRNSALFVLPHDKPVNSAYFSRTDGCRLLTTDQYSQVRVYQSPSWHLDRTLHHPHRFFQHITPIKATWHPLQDLVVVGRYPSKDFPGFTNEERRTIDVFDADSGEVVHQLHDPSAPGIVSLNKFNDRGDFLVSGMGVNLLLWGRSAEVEDRQQSMMTAHAHDLDLMGSNGQRSGRRSAAPRQRPLSSKNKSPKETDTKMKLETKTKTQTKNSKK